VLLLTDIWWWPTFFWCCNSILTWLFDPQHYLFVLFWSSPSSDVDWDGVLGSFSSPLGFFHPPPLGLLLFIWLVLLGLHFISKLAIHTRCHLDHFHYLATSCMWFLPMNSGPLHSSPIDILLGVINGSRSFSLSIQLATNCPLELVSSCSKNPGQSSVLWWHTLCIPTCYSSMPNIPL
jgi:hypothetical protein